MPDRSSKLPLIDLAAQRRRLAGRIQAAIARVVEHGEFIMGPEVEALEQALADHAGVRHVVSCANGTDALLLVLLARGIGPGDAVFVPAFTFAASAEAVALAGATPVLVDVGADFTLDSASLEEAIEAVRRESALRPRAVVAADLFGQPARYEDLLPIARTHALFVLQDAAQSFGARWRGQPIGRQGDAAATSFYPSKPLGGYGDGGAVLTDDDDLAQSVRSLARHGVGAGGAHERIGRNSRLDTLQAGILLAKLPFLEQERLARAVVAQRYADGLESLVRVPRAREGIEPAWSYYTIESPRRDALADGLAARGIASAVYYRKPLHHQPAYATFPRAPRLSVAESLPGRVISLPIHADLAQDDQARIIGAISALVAQKGA
jgi:UDP-2-acetamido-2-deoxy-ribo-hexuluronate aminotransferase